MMRFVGSAVAAITIGALAAAAAAQPAAPEPPGAELLPQGEGRADTIRLCVNCHELQVVIQKRRDPAGWYEVMQMMRDRGAQGTDAEMSGITAYLIKAFPAAAAGP